MLYVLFPNVVAPINSFNCYRNDWTKPKQKEQKKKTDEKEKKHKHTKHTKQNKNVIKLFCSKFTLKSNKLERLSVARNVSQSQPGKAQYS